MTRLKLVNAENDVFEHVSDHTFRWRIIDAIIYIFLYITGITMTPYGPLLNLVKLGYTRGLLYKYMCCRYSLKRMCWGDCNVYLECMSLVLRKPVFGVSDKVRHKPGCAATEDG